jgi:uncharacterized membrane protein (UPF0127 family)
MSRPHFLATALGPTATRLDVVASREVLPLAARVELAASSSTRRRGLLGRDALESDQALVIAPTFAIHTFGMRFSIDVVFARRDGRVIKVVHGLRPGRIAWAPGAFAAVELSAGSARAVTAGQVLRLEPLPR